MTSMTSPSHWSMALVLACHLSQDADVQGTIKIGEVEQGPAGLVAPGEAGCFLSSGLRGRFSLWDKGLGGLLGL